MRMASAVLAAASVLGVLVSGGALAQSETGGKCAEWVAKKGYSTDYIEHKTGKRQPGPAKAWKGNVEPREVQPGDVVITSFVNAATGASGEMVSYVEQVEPDPAGGAAAVFVTDWNTGRRYDDKACNVTDRFGIAGPTQRRPIGTVLRVWRTSLPLN